MTDRELLELAAKAAGIELSEGDHGDMLRVYFTDQHNGLRRYTVWNPLVNDGDALRLVVKLSIDLVRVNLPTGVGISAYDGKAPSAFEKYTDDPCAATRRAIVRAAAEIGNMVLGGL